MPTWYFKVTNAIPRRLRYSLRTLLGLMLLSACGAMYVGNQIRLYESQAEALKFLSSISSGVIGKTAAPVKSWYLHYFVDEALLQRVTAIWLYRNTDLNPLLLERYRVALANLPWLEEVDARWAGDHFENYDLALLAATHPELQRLWIYDAAITDRGFSALSRFENLRDLGIGMAFNEESCRGITEEGVKKIFTLTSLERLTLAVPSLTSEWLDGLKNLQDLVELNLSEIIVDDSIVEKIRPCRRLKVLDLSFSRVTPSGVRALASLPNLQEIELDESDTENQ